MKHFRLAAFAALACLSIFSVSPAMAAATICDTPQLLTQNAGALCSQQYAATASVTKTRPANTTTYTANTAWAEATTGATVWTFTNMCRTNGKVAELTTVHVTDAANQATKLQGILFLFDASPTAINDNGAFTIASADWSHVVAEITIAPTVVYNTGSGAAGAVGQTLGELKRQVKCGSATTTLYGMLEVTNTYAPITAEPLTLTLAGIGRN